MTRFFERFKLRTVIFLLINIVINPWRYSPEGPTRLKWLLPDGIIGGIVVRKALSLNLNFNFLNRTSPLVMWSCYPSILTKLDGPVPDDIFPEKFLDLAENRARDLWGHKHGNHYITVAVHRFIYLSTDWTYTGKSKLQSSLQMFNSITLN